LAAVDWVGWRGDSSRRHDLDVRSAAAQFLSHRFPHCVHAVSNHSQLISLVRAAAEMARIERMIPRSKVAVASGLRKETATVKQPGDHAQQTILDR